MGLIMTDILKEWAAVDEQDRAAIVGSLRAHVRYSRDRQAQLRKQFFPEEPDQSLMNSHDKRIQAAELAIRILDLGDST